MTTEESLREAAERYAQACRDRQASRAKVEELSEALCAAQDTYEACGRAAEAAGDALRRAALAVNEQGHGET